MQKTQQRKWWLRPNYAYQFLLVLDYPRVLFLACLPTFQTPSYATGLFPCRPQLWEHSCKVAEALVFQNQNPAFLIVAGGPTRRSCCL